MGVLREVLEPYVGTEVPGVVAAVARGDDTEVVVLGDAGWDGPPLTRDAAFRIASITKPVVATAALRLVADGALDLDEPVGRLLPELVAPRVLVRPDGPLDATVPADRAITVRDVLTYTCGQGQDVAMYVADEPWPLFTAERGLDLHTFAEPLVGRMPDPDTWLRRLATLPLVAQPGARWLYNTSGAVLGVLAARAAGTSLAELLRTRLFADLGMTRTGFHGDGLVTAYRRDRTVFDPPDGDWSRPQAFQDGSGGLVSTVDDLVAYGRAMLRGSLLPADLHGAMTSPQVTAEQIAGNEMYLGGARWGYGQAVHPDGSYGWDGGFGTSYRAYPDRDVVVVVLTNVLWESPTDAALHDAVRAAVTA